MGRLDNRAPGSGCSSLAWALQLVRPLRVLISTAAGHGDVSQTRTCTQELSPTAPLPPSLPPLCFSIMSPAPRLHRSVLLADTHPAPPPKCEYAPFVNMQNACKFLQTLLAKYFFANNFCKLFFFFFFFLTGKCPRRQPTHQTESSESNTAVGEGSGAEAQQKPEEMNMGMARGLSQSLPAGWGSPGAQAHSYGQSLSPTPAPDSTEHLPRDVADTHGQKQRPLLSQCRSRRCAKALAGQQIPKDGNEFNSIPAPTSPLSQPVSTAAVPQQLPGLTAGMQPPSAAPALPCRFWGAGSRSLSGCSILSQQGAHLGTPCLLGNPFLWPVSSDAARDISVPLGPKYISA